jgi:hypothetical protein
MSTKCGLIIWLLVDSDGSRAHPEVIAIGYCHLSEPGMPPIVEPGGFSLRSATPLNDPPPPWDTDLPRTRLRVVVLSDCGELLAQRKGRSPILALADPSSEHP